jgi:hypothetical protein
MDSGTDSGSPTAGVVEIMETCPAFTACGGDLVGTWRYERVCVTTAEVEAQLTDTCATAVLNSGSGTVDGTVSFDGTMLVRDVVLSVSVDAFVPSSCTFGASCDEVGPLLVSVAMVDAATCTDASGGCNCQITTVETTSDNDPYTVTGNTFENTTTTRRWDYCVEGTEMTAREIMGGDGDPPVEPGTQFFAAES